MTYFDLIGVILLSAAGILIGLGLTLDAIVRGLPSRWEPLEIDRGEIKAADQ